MRYQIESFPKISVVTPSFNQGQYLRETLSSIVEQRYPNLELIVFDGGSTDQSVEVIKSFADHIAYWASESDRGQCDAINKGFARATGDIVCWLNSDDVFLPGALNAVAHVFITRPECNWLSAPSLKFGEALHEISGRYELPNDAAEWMVNCPISQPSTFWRRSLYDRHGGLDESFHYALDYEYWVRFVVGGESLHFVDRPLSAYRLHDVSKTVAHSEKFKAEEERIREKHAGALSAALQSRLASLLARADYDRRLIEAVALLQDQNWNEARKGVLEVIKERPGMLFTKTGAASLWRVATKRPRYNE